MSLAGRRGGRRLPPSGDASYVASERSSIEQAVALATGRVQTACDPDARWAQRVRGGLLALLELAEEEPELARVCIAQALCSRSAHPSLDRALGRLIHIIDEGRDASPSAKQPPSVAAQSGLGGALGLVYARLVSGDHSS